jgi:uncharacterized protein (TIGR03086 family)
MTPFEALELSRAEFERPLDNIRASQWSLPTPCPDWSVWALVNHVVGGICRYTSLLHGATAEAVDATRALDHISPDPLRAFRAGCAEMIAAFQEPGALRRTVHHRAGDRSGGELLEMRVLEFTVHGWDLARAIGADDQLNRQLVERVVGRLVEVGANRDGVNAFAPSRGPLSPDASVQDRMLHLTGRAQGQ